MGERIRIVSEGDSGTSQWGERIRIVIVRDSGTRVNGMEDQNRECERDSGTNQWEKGYES